MLISKIDLINTEQLLNKPGFHKSLPTGDGEGGTTLATTSELVFLIEIIVSYFFIIFNKTL